MEHKYDILDSLVKSEKPEVPNGFFENFSASLDTHAIDESTSIGTTKKNKPEVPKDFFENFSSQLMDKIEAEELNHESSESLTKHPIFSIRNISIVTSIAACLIIGIFIFNQEDTIETDTNIVVAESESNESVLTESDEAYLAFLDEDELIDFLIENEDISLNETTDEEEDITEDLYFMVDGEIEDFYLEDL